MDIDLSKIYPSEAGSKISGRLTIFNPGFMAPSVSYQIGFDLVCNDKAYCEAKEEEAPVEEEQAEPEAAVEEDPGAALDYLDGESLSEEEQTE